MKQLEHALVLVALRRKRDERVVQLFHPTKKEQLTASPEQLLVLELQETFTEPLKLFDDEWLWVQKLVSQTQK